MAFGMRSVKVLKLFVMAWYSFRLFTIWILLVHTFPTFLMFMDPHEDEFVNLYGNDVNSSGIWQSVKDLVSSGGDDILTNISYQVHTKFYEDEVEIDHANLLVKELLFTNENYQNINVDVILYKVTQGGAYYFFITKGLKPDCVFYLLKIDTRATLFQLGNHVCGIAI